MLDDDTFYKEIKTSKPATQYKIDEKNIIVDDSLINNWGDSALAFITLDKNYDLELRPTILL